MPSEFQSMIEQEAEKFKAMMTEGIRSHPQFKHEFPRLWEFRFDLLGHYPDTGQEIDQEYILLLHADREDVQLVSYIGQTKIEIKITPNEPGQG